MNIKSRLIAIYEKIYASNLVMNAIYKYKNRNHKLNILNSEETIKYILKNECSVTRFGEGEFELILDPNNNLGFQKSNVNLSKRLEAVLGNSNSQLLICVPYALNDIGGRTEHSRRFWYNWGRTCNQHHRIVSLIHKLQPYDYQFGDTQISRPYIAYKTPNRGANTFKMLKKLWDKRDVLFVEGEKTRMGVGNDLFDNVKSIKRILCPAVNAFDCYEDIVTTVVNNWNGELILLAVGPTATVLAADFADRGMRSIDLGHIDIEYEWFLSGATDHQKIAGKFTNEALEGNDVSDCDDELYNSQIISHINRL